MDMFGRHRFYKARSLESQWDDREPVRPKKSCSPMTKKEETEYRSSFLIAGLPKKLQNDLVSSAKRQRKAESLSKDPRKAKVQLKKYEKDHTDWVEAKRKALGDQRDQMAYQDQQRRQRDSDAQRPYKSSDGYWHQWINDGRGGYDQILPRGEQDRLDYDGGR